MLWVLIRIIIKYSSLSSPRIPNIIFLTSPQTCNVVGTHWKCPSKAPLMSTHNRFSQRNKIFFFFLQILLTYFKYKQISFGLRHAKKGGLRAYAYSQGSDKPAHVRSLIRAFTVRNRISGHCKKYQLKAYALKRLCMQGMNLNLCILRTFEDTFSIGAAYFKILKYSLILNHYRYFFL